MGLHSRAGAGLLKEFLSPSNCPYGKSAGSLKSRPLPPVGWAFLRLSPCSLLLTTSGIPAIATRFKQKLVANSRNIHNSKDGLAGATNPFVRDEQAKGLRDWRQTHIL
jgi:hypothetical protein